MIKKILITNLVIWLISYLICCFCYWEILNPLYWIIELPNFSIEKRGKLLIEFIIIQVFITSLFLKLD